MNTAIQLELFTRIAHGTDTASKIAAELGVPVRGIRILCEYLASIGLLEKEDEQLRLTTDVALFLDKKSSLYLGKAADILYSPQLMQSYARLTESLRAGKSGPDNAVRPAWFDLARGLSDPAAAVKAFVEVVTFPAGRPLKILNIGAGCGTFGIALGVRYPDAVIVALDYPESLRKAQEYAETAKLGTRYQNIPGDPLLVPLGLEYDAVIIAGGLHQYDSSQITSLLMRTRYALKKSGQLLILEFLTEDGSRSAGDFAGFRLNMLAATPRGDAYSLAEVKGMLESSGFRSIEAQPLAAACATLVTAKL